MNTLGTGSSGTIGTALCIELIKKGYGVIGVDIKPNEWNSEVDQCTIMSDLLGMPILGINFKGNFDMIIHLAANAKVHQSVKTPELALDNFLMTYNVLEFARRTNTPVIFSSSREVYGDNAMRCERSEGDIDLDRLRSPYAATKLGVEALIQAYHHSYNLDYLIFRLSNVYGKYDKSDRVIPTWIKAARNGEDLIVYGAHKAYDFTYIDDCVAAFMLGIEQFKSAKNDTYNIAFGEATKLTDLAAMIPQAVAAKGELKIKANRVGEVGYYRADIDYAHQKFGYEPKVDIKEGIKNTVKWYNKNMENKK
jgi:UDP-glucose 4-epimerase